MSGAEHYAITQTTVDKRPIMWKDSQLLSADFKAILTLTRKSGQYRCVLHLGGAHVAMPLYTVREEEAHHRAEQLYDMAVAEVEKIAHVAERGFMFRSELANSNSEDT